jgi:hypothetical protein
LSRSATRIATLAAITTTSLDDGGFELLAQERHDQELVRIDELSGAFDAALELLELARDAAMCGRIGYAVLIARARL